jgi:hypothetical protein
MLTEGLRAVSEAIGVYRRGGRITSDDRLARLAVSLSDVRIRDDAWARMVPDQVQPHLRLWTDLVRRVPARYVPAPASLLAFTAWQAGNGALANVAAQRALAADPGYSMALLLLEAIGAGIPPSAARLPMTPEEVAASYARAEPREPGEARSEPGAAEGPSGCARPAPRRARGPAARSRGSPDSARGPSRRARRPSGGARGPAVRPRGPAGETRHALGTAACRIRPSPPGT